MQIYPFSPDNQNLDHAISRSIEWLNRGELIAIPTETVYGLAGDATNGIAVARIFEMKGRPQFNPLIAHVSDLEMALQYGEFDETSLELAKKFWPGALTLVVKRKADFTIHPLVTAGLDTIAIRCPGGITAELIKRFGKPVAAPSANRSGKVSATIAEHVASEFSEENLIILDGGPCKVGLESTIAKVESNTIRILRSGSVTDQQLAEYTGLPVELAEAGSSIEAPGMLKSHYAPKTNVEINCRKIPEHSAFLNFGRNSPSDWIDAAATLNLSEKGNLLEAASNLYDYLRRLDELGLDRICVAPIPDEGLGIAINDRLSRAAAPRPNHQSANNNSA